jgi:probable F420-dependent oxidoreductase
VKVRIGISLGAAGVPGEFTAAVDELERAGVDSLWLPEMVYGPLVEPFIGMAHALSRTAKLKVGTGVSVLPGRHPVLVAKQLASLAGLAPGRVLPVFGLRPARRNELGLFPVAPGQRAAVFDESLRLLRLLLRQDTVSFEGTFFTVEGASIGPLPAKPLDIWLGGAAPGALQRIGRLADGWLASLITPEEAGAGRRAIEAAAAAAGREVEPDHYGISLAVATEGIPVELIAAVRERRPDADPASLVAASWPDARRMIEAYVAQGLSKFVVRPAGPLPRAGSRSADRFLGQFVSEMMPLQT